MSITPLFPISFKELVDYHGLYPEVVMNAGNEQEVLKFLADSYFYKTLSHEVCKLKS